MSDVAVPDDHRVVITGAVHQPLVTVATCGAIVADLGTSSDDAEAELARIGAEVDARCSGERPVVIVANSDRGPLSDLFAPNNPTVMPIDGLVLWVVDADRYACTPALCGKLVDQLRKNRIMQTVFVRGEDSARANAAIAAIQAADIGVRRLTSFGDPPRHPTLIEVFRPDHVLATLGGVPVAPLPLTGLPGGELPLLARAPHLNQLVFEAFDADRTALYTELKGRPWPLIGFGHPSGAVRTATWPNGVTAMPVFADRMMARQAAAETGLDPDNLPIVAGPPASLFKGAGDHGISIALGAFTPSGEAKYIVLSPDELKQLV